MSGEAAPAAPAPAAAAAAAAAAETPAESTPRNGFTKEQLKQILPELAAALRDLIKVTPEKFNLCGTNEQKIDVTNRIRIMRAMAHQFFQKRVIENEQRRVLVKLGFDAEIGMANLRRVARDYKNDKEIMRPFGAMVQFEELTTTLVIARNGGKKPSPQQVAKMMQNIQQLSYVETDWWADEGERA
jgi:arsenate reductase-like glutaredoxin family protein